MDALTSHYIAAVGFSRILSGLFMWNAQAINVRIDASMINSADSAKFMALGNPNPEQRDGKDWKCLNAAVQES